MVQCNKGLCSCLLVLATQAMGHGEFSQILLCLCCLSMVDMRRGPPGQKCSPGAEGWGNIVSEPILNLPAQSPGAFAGVQHSPTDWPSSARGNQQQPLSIPPPCFPQVLHAPYTVHSPPTPSVDSVTPVIKIPRHQSSKSPRDTSHQNPLGNRGWGPERVYHLLTDLSRYMTKHSHTIAARPSLS